MYAMMKYDDTAITLADTRSQLKNSIVKHYVEIKKSELSNLVSNLTECQHLKLKTAL